MASGRRKSAVLKKDLPPVIRLDDNSFGYLVRHRIISEDRNRFSAWSPIEKVVAFDSNFPAGTVGGDLLLQGSSVGITWDDAADRPYYDIFVSFDGGDYFYHGTSPIHSYSIVNPAATSSISVIIQVEGINKEVDPILTICTLNATIGT